MSHTQLNLGTTANDGTGDNLRAGGAIINANFALVDNRNRTDTVPPSVTDDVNHSTPVEVSTIWINTTDDSIYICTDNTDGAAVWKSMPTSNSGTIDGGDATG